LSINLLIAADKYDIPELHTKMEQHFTNILNSKNVYEILMYAHLYNYSKLKGCCFQIIKKRKKKLDCPDLKNYFKDNPDLLLELFDLLCD